MDSLGLRGRFRFKENCRAVFVKGWPSAQQEQQCLASIRNANSTDSEGSPGGSEVKNLPDNAGDVGFIPGSGRFSGEGNGSTLQYSCLRNPMDREAWRATVHGVTKSQHNLVTNNN